MSLEQVLIEATAAITRLTTVLVSATEAGVVTAPAAEKSSRKSKSDTQVVAATATPTAAQPEAAVTTGGYPANEGDPAGTRYFHIPAHNTVYKQLPGMPDCTIAGALIVSGAEFLNQQAELAKKFPTASAAVTPTPATSAPTATAQPVTASVSYTFEQVVEKLRAMHKTQGDTGVAKVLAKFGVNRVPELNGKVDNAAVVEFIATLGA